MTAFPPIEQRPIPGSSATPSVLGIVLEPPATAAPAVDRGIVGALRRARERGITTFDLAHGGPLARAERLIAAAFAGGSRTIPSTEGVAELPGIGRCAMGGNAVIGPSPPAWRTPSR